jgi:hypothetical protein
LPPDQRITATRGGRAEPKAHAEQRAHADLAQLLRIEDLHLDAELLEFPGAPGEFLRIERVGGLVDEVARHVDPVGDRVEGLKGLARGRGGRGQHAHLLEVRAVVLLLLGLVAVEAVGTQAKPRGQQGGDLAGLHRRLARQFGRDRRLRRLGRLQQARRRAAQHFEVARLELADVAGAEHDDAVELGVAGRDDLDRLVLLALELRRRHGARHMAAGRLVRLLAKRRQRRALSRQQQQSARLRQRGRGKPCFHEGHPVVHARDQSGNRSLASRGAPCNGEAAKGFGKALALLLPHR